MFSIPRIAVFCAAGALIACQNGTPSKAPPKSEPSATIPKGAEAAAPGAARLPADHVVAKWNGGQLTYGELRSKRQSRFDALETKYKQEVYQLEQAELEGHISDMLIEQEAKKANMEPEAFVEKVAGSEKVTDEEARAFFDENLKNQGVQFELVRERIVQVLEAKKKQENVQAMLERVRKEAAVETDLPEPPAAVAKFDLEGRPSKGPASAKVTIVEFSDFECPYCSRAVPGVDALLEKYKDDLQVYFLHFPLSFHKRAIPAAVASMCAHRQDKFWPMHDKIFETARDLSDERFLAHAKAIGLDEGKFKACLEDKSIEKMIRADMEQGAAAGVQGTPSFFVNGVQHQGIPTVEVIEKALRDS